MSVDKSMSDIPDEVIQSLARTLLSAIREYFDSEEGQKEFSEWKKRKENEAGLKSANPDRAKESR